MTSAPLTLTLHGFPLSGHSHRAELMLNLLGLPYTFRQVDLGGGEHRTPEFLALNMFGQVPVLVDGDTVITDSTAIMVYLATTYDPSRSWYPENTATAAEIQRWLAVAQGPVFNGPCSARLVKVFGADLDLARAKNVAHKLFTTLEGYLNGREWLVADRPTLADVAQYSYIARAPEGEVSLDEYPEIRRWLAGIEALPRFFPMPHAGK